MSYAKKIKENVQKKKEGFSSETEFRELINSASVKMLRQFIQRMEAGEIPMDNVSDFIRVIGAYKEINNISDVMDGNSSSGALPELNMRQEKVLNDSLGEGEIKQDEEGHLEVTDMSEEDLAELIRKLDVAQNRTNEEAY